LQTIGLKHLFQLSGEITRTYGSKTWNDVSPKTLLTLLDLGPESELQQEIRDIIVELEIMTYIVKQQEEVIKKFIEQAKQILGPGVEIDNNKINEMPINKQRKYVSFRDRAKALLCDVSAQLNELDRMTNNAQSVAHTVSHQTTRLLFSLTDLSSN
jgi:hypothetical protein